ncbi:MAG: glycoside hydrolase family 127 protein, partial [Phycisphaerae bacterium]|nr:glycoside hydrolase family 127 protein [Phycisphaerae bacterium]
MNDNRELAATNGRLAALSCGVFAVVLCGVQIGCSAGISTRLPRNIPTAYKYAKLKPAGSGQAAITGGYLLPYIDRSMDRGVLDYLDKFEEHGFIENFRIVGKKLEKKHSGWANCNEFVYKLVEAAGYYAPRSDKIAKAFAKTNADILSAQCQDGYLNTFYENPLIKKKNPNNRFLPNNRFEFYNFGHFTQGAIAWYRTTGDRTMLDASVRFADLICKKFSAPKMLPYTRNRNNRPNLKYEHPDHEMAMVELYRVTGDKRYLEFAKHTLDQYDFWKFEEIWGHAVQETLLLCGGTDVYLEYGRADMLTQLKKMWRDVHDRKMYITGGVG